MSKLELHEIDLEDLNDFIFDLEKTFQIQFHDNELSNCYKLGELFDLVESKLDLKNQNDCTTQQGFIN